MENFNWYEEKVALRATLNACIRQGLTYKETEKVLNAQFAASCNVCVFATMGNNVCDRGHNCFIEKALEKYLEVAKEKCSNSTKRV